MLTTRERQVAGLIAQGLLHKQIAFYLGITEKTVTVHCYYIRQKLGLSGRRPMIPLKVHLRGNCRTELIALSDALDAAETGEPQQDSAAGLW